MLKVLAISNPIQIEIPPSIDLKQILLFLEQLDRLGINPATVTLQFSDTSNNLPERKPLLEKITRALKSLDKRKRPRLSMTLCSSNHSPKNIKASIDSLIALKTSSLLPLLGARPVKQQLFKSGLEFFDFIAGHPQWLANLTMRIPLYLNSEATPKGIEISLQKSTKIQTLEGKYHYVTIQLYHSDHFAKLKQFRKQHAEEILAGICIFSNLEEQQHYEDLYHLDPSFKSDETHFYENQKKFITTVIKQLGTFRNVKPIFKCFSSQGLAQLQNIFPHVQRML